MSDPNALSESNLNLFLGQTLHSQYADLPDIFRSVVTPTPVSSPSLIAFNAPLAEALGLNKNLAEHPETLAILSGNKVLLGSKPVAQVYAGHQFGHFNPQLGDGRAILLGEIQAPSGQVFDIQLKGSGPTPYSRNGDGRAALGPIIREYMVSEAMHSLGISTTRILAAAATGDSVFRQAQLPGAILTRVASSHLRIGTFEYFHARGQTDAVQTLADFAIQRHYPSLKQSPTPYLELLHAVIAAQAQLVASWLHVGFIHGVMNTDNMAVSGETIDYGPCAFMDTYDPDTVFSSIDRDGRYAYGNQANIAYWNLSRFGECLLPLIETETNQGEEALNAALKRFPEHFNNAWLTGMRNKMGLNNSANDDLDLIKAFLDLLHSNRSDYTLAFRHLADAIDPHTTEEQQLQALFQETPELFAQWLAEWRARLPKITSDQVSLAAAMRATNPLYIARNHQVEAVIAAAQNNNDYAPMQMLISVLKKPFTHQPDNKTYAAPPQQTDRLYKTFCGT